MAYVEPNVKSGAALKRLIDGGGEATVFQPGGFFPLTPDVVKGDFGYTVVEGPHNPEPHRFAVGIEYDLKTRRVTRVLKPNELSKIYRGR